MGQDDFERIKPASLDLSPPPPPSAPEARVARQPSGAALLLLALLLVAAGVIFVLPRFVGEPSLPSGAAAPAGTGAAPGATGNAANPVSPWEKAQLERERAAAKTALDALLALQFELEERGATKWAAEEFGAALEQARAGDEAYRNNAFAEAQKLYSDGRDRLQALLDGADQRLQDALEAGDKALAARDAAAATGAFNNALAIDPANQRAQDGLRRAATIEPVDALMASAASALAAGDSDAAGASYREALALEPGHAPAREALAALQARRAAGEYGARLSAGYAALAAGKLEQAQREFRAALKISPGGAEARDGLQQAEFQLSQQRIAAAMQRAAKAAAAENWQAALEGYDAALAIDASLGPAREGKQQAETRLALDSALERIVREPAKLTSGSALDAAERLVTNAAAIPDPGPRLSAQIAAASAELQKLRTRVTVRFVSDGKTDVTVFRVGGLGLFGETSRELLPGKYVAVGQRDGYRDVRVEFTVEPGITPPPVNVQCVQKI